MPGRRLISDGFAAFVLGLAGAVAAFYIGLGVVPHALTSWAVTAVVFVPLAISTVAALILIVRWRRERARLFVSAVVFSGSLVLAFFMAAGALGKYLQESVELTVLDPASYSDDAATIEFSAKSPSILYFSEASNRRRYRLESADGVFLVPPGRYAVEIYFFDADKASGKPWFFSYRFSNLKIALARGDVAHMEFPRPPYTAKVLPQQRGESTSFILALSDARGGELFIGRNGPSDFIGFEMLSKSGETLFRGPFSFGWSPDARYDGSVPTNIRGPVTLRPVIDKCPDFVRKVDTVWQR